MKQFFSAVLCVVVQFLLTGSARAQFNANFQTIIISGVRSNWAGFGGYVVGSNTFGDVLIIQNGGVLSNFYGTIGDLNAASNNTAIVTDSGSSWSNYAGLAVGGSGAGNNLVISNGGIVWVGPDAITIGSSSTSSNNKVTVTGTGSALTNNSDLYVGYAGKGNQMTISGGGAVHDGTGYVGNGLGGGNDVVLITDPGSVWTHDAIHAGKGYMVFGENTKANQMTITNGGALYCGNCIIGNATASSSNIVTITGAGSVWTIPEVSPGTGGGLEVGNGGPANQLTISDGAAVHSTHGIVGGAGKNDVVTVTGTGSVWDSMGDLTVGNDGNTNTLTIGPGGSVVATNAYVSYLSGAGNRINIEGGSLIVPSLVTIGNDIYVNCSSSGTITVDAGELIVTNAAHNAALEVLSGTLTLNGGTTVVDRLVITNACARFVHAGGTLIVGSYVFDTNKFRTTAVAPSSNDVLLTWMMGPGATNALQAAPGNPSGGFATNAFVDIFVVTNNSTAGTVTNYLDVGAGTNKPARYYRVRLVP